jgi:hypothetical protein
MGLRTAAFLASTRRVVVVPYRSFGTTYRSRQFEGGTLLRRHETALTVGSVYVLGFCVVSAIGSTFFSTLPDLYPSVGVGVTACLILSALCRNWSDARLHPKHKG